MVQKKEKKREMALSYTTTIASSLLHAATPSLPNKKSFWIEKEALFRIASKLTVPRNGRSSSVEFDVPFPRDYEELLDQCVCVCVCLLIIDY